jgi:hypothetical protein
MSAMSIETLPKESMTEIENRQSLSLVPRNNIIKIKYSVNNKTFKPYYYNYGANRKLVMFFIVLARWNAI